MFPRVGSTDGGRVGPAGVGDTEPVRQTLCELSQADLHGRHDAVVAQLDSDVAAIWSPEGHRGSGGAGAGDDKRVKVQSQLQEHISFSCLCDLHYVLWIF